MKLKTALISIFTGISLIAAILLFASIFKNNSQKMLDILITAVAILICVAFLMIIWVYSSILKPLEKLQEATRKIKEGNLDFTLDFEEHDEIGQLCMDFEEMRIRLKENEEEKLQTDKDNKELISNISHDLKTPITAIKGYVEGIMDGVASSPEKLDKYIRTIYNKANDMDRLIDELTFYTKIDTNKIPYNYQEVNIMDFFQDCASQVGLDMEAAGIGFVFESGIKKDTVVVADVEQMKRVVNNIIGNSVKYLDKSNGMISIKLADDGDFVKIDITDNGRGIAQSDLPYIFDRFYRGDYSRNSSTGGSGIGLSIVKKIVEAHGGFIRAESSVGRGTDIIILLRKYHESKKKNQGML
ncbi:hypothetical protein HMPREF9333_00920 [Johnsonella ignava ATCC 51276]|uniref:histidine kinase n=1 Tax=Johnsonella ignava ATCC 51276 TaxID=679200 RepID=G5GH80_9FIRM|nr:HAMP domain-containing sensor histidine kinase [Johnsonella ignava]EHI55877.1 hypothetical protein HMPREF9333_00920 [Johnsonella ignava ATCC 51276]